MVKGTVVRIPIHLLLFLQLVGGGKVVKKLAIHLHEGLQDVVDERHDSSEEEKEKHPEALPGMTHDSLHGLLFLIRH